MYQHRYNPFDLLAEAFVRMERQSAPSLGALNAEEDAACRQSVLKLLAPLEQKLKYAALFGLEPQLAAELLQSFRALRDYHQLRWLVIELDALLSWESFARRQGTRPFMSMNDNAPATGILILPKVPQICTHFPGRTRRGAQRWYAPINECLRNCYAVPASALNVDGIPYTLSNVIYQTQCSVANRESLMVVFSPLCKQADLQLRRFARQLEDGHTYNYFSVRNLGQSEAQVLAQYCRAYQAACILGADIVMAPELLCSEALFAVDPHGFNSILYEICRNVRGDPPSLALAPTRAADGRNLLRVYDKTARLLLTQDKQYPFTHTEKDPHTDVTTHYTEDLLHASRCINLLHIPHWGRLGFPICMDFLHTQYRDLLVRTLGASLLFCPSYSAGSTEFELALSEPLEFQCTCLWGNSCAALPHWNEAECIGAVCLPNVGSQAGPLRLSPICQGSCSSSCLFLIHIPLNCAGPTRRQDIGARVIHYPSGICTAQGGAPPTQ